jgi:hypothetical protein
MRGENISILRQQMVGRRRSSNDEKVKCTWDNRRRGALLCSTTLASLVAVEQAILVS